MKRAFEETLQNASNEKANLKQKEDDTMSAERIQILESGTEALISKKPEAEVTIFKSEEKDEIRSSENQMHNKDEKKLADQNLKVLEQSDDDMMHVQEKHTKLITQMKQDHSEQLKCMKEKTSTTWKYFEHVIEELACGLEDKCQKLENQFSSDVLVEENKAVKDIEEIKASHDKILSDCKEESTRQQLLHILEEHTKLVAGMHQDRREQLKALRQETISTWKYFENKIGVLGLVLDDEGSSLEDEFQLLDDDDEGQSLEADELLFLLLEK